MDDAKGQGRRDFWQDFAIAVVSLGFYMPYWLWARNRELRGATGDEPWMENVWLLTVGGLVAIYTPWIAYETSLDLTATMALTFGIVIFCAGGFVLARNGEAAAAALGTEWTFPPWLFGFGLAAAFLAVQAGDAVPSWTVRGPALALIAATPFYFYRLHDELENVREALALHQSHAEIGRAATAGELTS